MSFGQDSNSLVNQVKSSNKSSLKKASRAIQDYNFQMQTLASLSHLLLSIVSASTLTWINVPYQVLFLLQVILVGLNLRQTQASLARILSATLLILLVTETLVQYAWYIWSFSQTFSARDKYRREVIGLLQNTASFAVFALKILLILVEGTRVQF